MSSYHTPSRHLFSPALNSVPRRESTPHSQPQQSNTQFSTSSFHPSPLHPPPLSPPIPLLPLIHQNPKPNPNGSILSNVHHQDRPEIISDMDIDVPEPSTPMYCPFLPTPPRQHNMLVGAQEEWIVPQPSNLRPNEILQSRTSSHDHRQ
jgi:hypothetical protein